MENWQKVSVDMSMFRSALLHSNQNRKRFLYVLVFFCSMLLMASCYNLRAILNRSLVPGAHMKMMIVGMSYYLKTMKPHNKKPTGQYQMEHTMKL